MIEQWGETPLVANWQRSLTQIVTMPVQFSKNYSVSVNFLTWSNDGALGSQFRVGQVGVYKTDNQNFKAKYYGNTTDDTTKNFTWTTKGY